VRELTEAVPAYLALTSARGDTVGLTASLLALGEQTDAVARACDLVRTDHALGTWAATWDHLLTSVVRSR
jgi:hypothetical protein